MNGGSWSALGIGLGGLDNMVSALAALPNGDLFLGGSFTAAAGIAASRVARWNGSSWSTLASGCNDQVSALAMLASGDLVAGGGFTIASGVPANHIARWNGTGWSALGGGLNSTVQALAVLPNGDLVAGGSFTTAGGVAANKIARWDGSSWSAIGSGMNSNVRAFAVLPNGDLVAGGTFTTAGGVTASLIARWNGIAWSGLGSGIGIPGFPGSDSVNALAVLPNGDLVAGGSFTTAGGVTANRIARWNGSAWSALGGGFSSTVMALAVLPNGDLVAGGVFTTAGGVTVNRIARWNGSAWSALGGGLADGCIALAVLPTGQLAVGGNFLTAGGNVSAYFARYATPCVATVASSGAACASSSGASTYAALTQPWTGAAYRTRGTGLPAFAFVAVVTGFAATAIPLAAVLPPSPAGCTLLAAPDVVDIALATAGTVDAQLALPNTSALAGVALHQQLVALELDAQLNFVQNTSTNALVATIGTF